MHNKKHPLGCSLGYIFKFSVLNNKLKNTIQTEDQKVGMTSDGEGGNFWFMSPKGVRWEVDAVNETVRFFNYLTMAGFTIDKVEI